MSLKLKDIEDLSTEALLDYCRVHKAVLKTAKMKALRNELDRRGISVTPKLIATLQFSHDIAAEVEDFEDEYGSVAVILVNLYSVVHILTAAGLLPREEHMNQLRNYMTDYRQSNAPLYESTSDK